MHDFLHLLDYRVLHWAMSHCTIQIYSRGLTWLNVKQGLIHPFLQTSQVKVWLCDLFAQKIMTKVIYETTFLVKFFFTNAIFLMWKLELIHLNNYGQCRSPSFTKFSRGKLELFILQSCWTYFYCLHALVLYNIEVLGAVNTSVSFNKFIKISLLYCCVNTLSLNHYWTWLLALPSSQDMQTVDIRY